MCSPIIASEVGSCDEQCDSQGSVIDFSQFCLTRCSPSSLELGGNCTGGLAPLGLVEGSDSDAKASATLMTLGTAVTQTTEEEAAQALDRDALSSVSQFQAPQEPEIAAKESQQSFEDTKRAAGLKAYATGLEARMSKSELASMDALSRTADAKKNAQTDAMDVVNADKFLRASAPKVAAFAEIAAQAAARARDDIAQIQRIPDDAAKNATAAAVAYLQNLTKAEMARVKERESLAWTAVSRPLPARVVQSVKRFAAPYDAAARQAFSRVAKFAKKEDELKQLASNQELQSKEMLHQSLEHARNGDDVQGQVLAAQAQEMMSQSTATMAQSQQWHQWAQDAEHSERANRVAAVSAEARAIGILSPGSSPPPPLLNEATVSPGSPPLPPLPSEAPNLAVTPTSFLEAGISVPVKHLRTLSLHPGAE